MEKETKKQTTTEKREQLATFMFSAFNVLQNQNATNPWVSSDIDKMELNTSDYQKIVQACRFFYQKDPIVSSTLNKLVEIGINEINFSKNGLTDNEFRIFESLKRKLREFAETLALEYLISGLVVPEVEYGRVNKQVIKTLGIKKYDSLILPVTMYVRDPETITVKDTPFGDQPSYFITVPEELVTFIKNKGKYDSETSDPEMYQKLLAYYPDFVAAIMTGQRKFLYEHPEMVIRRKPQPKNPYPVPYLSAALESLKHKRNLRRMDYAIASRVIGAIQLFKLGSDEYPVLADDQVEQFGAIKDQMLWRDGTGKDVERIFQLFANHTLQIEWVVPDTAALLNEQKYMSVNQDIIYALGFPRILITGESERTGTSDPQYAMMSPARTMDNFRDKIIEVLRKIVTEIADQNNLKNAPIVDFKPLTLFDHATLLKSLADLYAGGNISRHTYAGVLGFDWNDETDLREAEQKVLQDKQLGEFSPSNKPGSNAPGSNTPGSNTMEKPNSMPDNKPSSVNNQSNNKNGAN